MLVLTRRAGESLLLGPSCKWAAEISIDSLNDKYATFGVKMNGVGTIPHAANIGQHITLNGVPGDDGNLHNVCIYVLRKQRSAKTIRIGIATNKAVHILRSELLRDRYIEV